MLVAWRTPQAAAPPFATGLVAGPDVHKAAHYDVKLSSTLVAVSINAVMLSKRAPAEARATVSTGTWQEPYQRIVYARISCFGPAWPLFLPSKHAEKPP